MVLVLMGYSVVSICLGVPDLDPSWKENVTSFYIYGLNLDGNISLSYLTDKTHVCYQNQNHVVPNDMVKYIKLGGSILHPLKRSEAVMQDK